MTMISFQQQSRRHVYLMLIVIISIDKDEISYFKMDDIE